jgi:uncharacterized protein YjbJ (UPF0337 family)
MKASTKDRAAGKAHEVKGKMKEQVGRMTNNPEMEEEGADEKLDGKVRNTVGKIEKKLGA